ncbi:MAG: TerB family tellurite resistance protein [Myxococcota bacterium]|nr:TerB family tellurite resistance protein [Myxococcota bacterium]
MLQDLDRAERMRLMKFVCSFAWADLEIHRREREFVSRLVGRLELTKDEEVEVAGWLEVPPPAGELDPTTIPAQHRAVFVAAVRGMVEADGVVNQDERDCLTLFEQLLETRGSS